MHLYRECAGGVLEESMGVSEVERVTPSGLRRPAPITRVCPGCGKVVESSEVDACNEAGARYHHTQTFKLPLRRDHFDEWDCPTPDCPFNNDHVQNLERRYLVARLAQREGDLDALAPSLTADEDDPVPRPQLQADNMEGAEDDQPPQPRRRRRVTADVDVDALPNRIQQRIQALQTAIAAKRPPPPQFARRGAPRRKCERWIDEENELLLLLRGNEFGYNQIEQYFPWRNRNPLERLGAMLESAREKQRQGNA
ncbi:hypothetical protein C8A01DRAFT_50854 [Parachaetomium inaequale]|uniref:Uncharacterized protein n=1 Tax=Parachaetomium inaequale TaxID=2588326 RepID=A0AAN6P5U8_9PEZI|nr:hypothetical protein C8A01DRAFT_50854 [Parachaetomium inaequale]